MQGCGDQAQVVAPLSETDGMLAMDMVDAKGE
jgi:hypothetical protein